MNRREFLKTTLTIAGITLLSDKTHAKESSVYFRGNTSNKRNWEKYETLKKSNALPPEEPYAVLVDLTKCIGCRRCEWACNDWNKNPNKPIKEFEASRDEKPSVFDKIRRTHAGEFTVVNRFYDSQGNPVYVKKQCMHCVEPACLNACFVDAFKKTAEGSVLYNPSLCVGCRYCMIACPFDIPAYEYYEPLNPQITKCTMCFDRITDGKKPACVEICSADALKFGKRSEMLKIARETIKNNPEKYIDHIYGENEIGGTNWLYISSVPFEKLGFPKLDNRPIPERSKNFLFAVKVLEIVLAAPLVYGAYYMIKKTKEDRDGKNE